MTELGQVASEGPMQGGSGADEVMQVRKNGPGRGAACDECRADRRDDRGNFGDDFARDVPARTGPVVELIPPQKHEFHRLAHFKEPL
jgi:hypothetical protein